MYADNSFHKRARILLARTCMRADPFEISLDRTHLVQSQAAFGLTANDPRIFLAPTRTRMNARAHACTNTIIGIAKDFALNQDGSAGKRYLETFSKYRMRETHRVAPSF